MYQDDEMTEDLREIVQVAVKIATVVVAAGGAVLAALDHQKKLNDGKNKSVLNRLKEDFGDI